MKNEYDMELHMTTTELQATDLGQAHIECGWDKHVRRHPTLPYPRNINLTVNHRKKIYLRL